MARVYLDIDTNQWVHADTGNRIGAWDVRNTEPHQSEVAKRGGGPAHLYGPERIAGETTEPGTVGPQERVEVAIPPSNPQAEEQYVEEILSQANYV